jgi:rhodanese-related sulfurtransferase
MSTKQAHKSKTQKTSANPPTPPAQQKKAATSINKPPASMKPGSQKGSLFTPRNMLIGGLIFLLVVVVTILLLRNQLQNNTANNTTTVKATATLSAELPAEIPPAIAYQQYEAGAFFLDVRQPEEYDAGHIPGSTLIPLGELESRLDEIPTDKPIVVVCRSGNRSQQGRDILLNNGFAPVTSMSGGVRAWANAGHPYDGQIP